jgi:hypothetical protein
VSEIKYPKNDAREHAAAGYYKTPEIPAWELMIAVKS